MYKPSMFNFILDDADDEMVLFNAMAGLSSACRVKNTQTWMVRSILTAPEQYEEAANCTETFETLVRLGYLVDKTCDERQKREALFANLHGGSILSLIVLPTEQCNCRCKYCYESFEKGKMTEETQEALVRYVRKNIHNYTGLRVSWFGGEPLMAMDVIEKLSVKFMEICKAAKRKYVSNITCNGYLLTLETFKKLLGYSVINYQITIDGLKEVHDSKKPLANGGGTFDVIVKNLRDIKENVKSGVFSFVIRSNVTADALAGMDDFTSYFYNLLGDDQRFSFFLRPAGDWGGNNRLDEMVQERIEENQITRVYENFYKAGHPLRVKTHAGFYRSGGCMCYAGFKNSFVVDSQGQIRKCTCELDNEKHCLGKIDESGKKVIDESRNIQWVGNTTRLSQKCDYCNFSPLCFGASCPKQNFIERPGGNFGIVCPQEKRHILETLKLIEKTSPFIQIGEGA